MTSFLSPEDDLDVHLGAVIDLERYPLLLPRDHPDYLSLVQRCQKDLAEEGSASLPGFIRSDVIEGMAEEVSQLPSHNRLEIGTLYGVNTERMKKEVPEGTEITGGHPLLRKFPQDVHAVASDCVPPQALIRKVYDSKKVAQFLADVLQTDTLHQFADEFQAINIMYIHDGGNRAWHFDGSDFVVTLMLQPSLEGGEFEFSPFIRGAKVMGEGGGWRRDENYCEVQKVLSGQSTTDESHATRVKKSQAGTLNLFYGMRSLHRVRNVFGPRKRIMSVLSYHSEPDKHSTQEMNIFLYGDRVREIYASRQKQKHCV